MENKLEKVLAGIIIAGLIASNIMYKEMDNKNYSLIPLGITLLAAPVAMLQCTYNLLFGKNR